jgi:hypothetical protein
MTKAKLNGAAPIVRPSAADTPSEQRWLNTPEGSDLLRRRSAAFLHATSAPGSPGRRQAYPEPPAKPKKAK